MTENSLTKIKTPVFWWWCLTCKHSLNGELFWCFSISGLFTYVFGTLSFVNELMAVQHCERSEEWTQSGCRRLHAASFFSLSCHLHESLLHADDQISWGVALDDRVDTILIGCGCSNIGKITHIQFLVWKIRVSSPMMKNTWSKIF